MDRKVYTLGTAKFLNTGSLYFCISVGIYEDYYQIGGLYGFTLDQEWDRIQDVNEIFINDLHTDAVHYFKLISNVEDQLKEIFCK